MEQAIIIYVSLGISYWLVSMAPHWRELIYMHIESFWTSVFADVYTILECAIAWPYLLYCELTGRGEQDGSDVE